MATLTVLAQVQNSEAAEFWGFLPHKKSRKIGKIAEKSVKYRRFHRKLLENSSNRLSVEDIVSTSPDNRKIGDISPRFREILFLGLTYPKWYVGGDFNVMRRFSDKFGGIRITPNMRRFDEQIWDFTHKKKKS